VVASRLGCKDQTIKYGKISKLKRITFRPPSCVIIPGELHFKEEEFLEAFNA
jgi:diphthamide biosynthesis methyltransferase